MVDGDSDIIWEFTKPNADGTPGEFGRPSVITPLPAFTRKLSPWPW